MRPKQPASAASFKAKAKMRRSQGAAKHLNPFANCAGGWAAAVVP